MMAIGNWTRVFGLNKTFGGWYSHSCRAVECLCPVVSVHSQGVKVCLSPLCFVKNNEIFISPMSKNILLAWGLWSFSQGRTGVFLLCVTVDL